MIRNPSPQDTPTLFTRYNIGKALSWKKALADKLEAALSTRLMKALLMIFAALILWVGVLAIVVAVS